MNRLKEIETRMKAIGAEIENEDADLNALEQELDALKEERKAIMDKAEQRKKLMDSVASMGNVTVVEQNPREQRSAGGEVYGSESPEYRSAFLKTLMGQPLNETEQRAFLHTTANTDALVTPQPIADGIFSQIQEAHPILADVDFQNTGVAISVQKHTEIVAGDARKVAEGEANEDEENTFVNVELTGETISKHVDVSYKLMKTSTPAFEAYIVKELAERVGAAMARDIVAQVKSDIPESNEITVATAGTLAPADMLKALGALKAAPRAVVYANNSTIYTQIASMQDGDGRYLLLGGGRDDAAGMLFGKPIKEEDALADGEILVMDPNKFFYNVVEDIVIESDKNVKTGTYTIAGRSLAEGTMKNDRSAAVVTVGATTPS